MSDVVISAEGLSKRYRIGGPEGQATYRTLRETLVGLATSPVRRFRAALHGHPEAQSEQDVWALRDVSFEVKRGEVVGVIGHNGAGKSTLLKILSGITEPTQGRARVKGRVGSLLEVGTGFHNELTGRENIYLNGAILGMKKAEIARKFDEIVAFSEVERFLDTPVKHYSSGMYMRLAFAVAAHLDPEILLVDEVLAVGDAAFQKKCLGKMGEVATAGRTIIFVSHNMAAVSALCSRGLLLERGILQQNGRCEEVLAAYTVPQTVLAWRPAPGTDAVAENGPRITGVRVRDVADAATISSDSPVEFCIEYRSSKPLTHTTFAIGLFDELGTEVYFLESDNQPGFPEVLPPVGEVRCTTAPLNLSPGPCRVNVALVQGGVHGAGVVVDKVEGAIVFGIEPVDFFGTGKLPPRRWSLCLLRQTWSLAGRPG